MADIIVIWRRGGNVASESTTFKGCAFHIQEHTGALTILRGTEILVVYAAGCWQSVADQGALIQLRNDVAAAAQQDTPSENPRRRQEARAIPKA
jgi:hypothetical protein